MIQLREIFFSSLPLVSLAGLVLVLLLLRFAPSERKAVTWTGLVFLLSCALLWVMESSGASTWIDLGWVGEIILWLTGFTSISLLSKALFRLLLPKFGIHAPRILQDIVLLFGALAWSFSLLSSNDVDVRNLIATSAVITAVIAFSLQDTLGNLLGGVAIQLDRSVRVGEWIQVGDKAGKVQEIRWRHTSIETRNWETLVIPNSVLVKNSFLVLGRRANEPVQWRRWVWFNVDFRYSPVRVIQTVEKAVRTAEIPGVSQRPAPNCVTMGFSDSFAKYALRYWLTDLAKDDPTDSEVRAHIYFGLKRAEIPLSIPAQALFLTEESDARSSRKADEELKRRIAALKQVDIFSKLEEENLREMARNLVPAPFVAGDIMTRAGSSAHWLYIIVSGSADVLVSDSEGDKMKVGELEAGECFGEIALLTGGKRLASVIARTEVECYRLDRETFLRVLSVNQELRERITKAIRERSASVAEGAHTLDEKARERELARKHVDLRQRVRQFFLGS